MEPNSQANPSKITKLTQYFKPVSIAIHNLNQAKSMQVMKETAEEKKAKEMVALDKEKEARRVRYLVAKEVLRSRLARDPERDANQEVPLADCTITFYIFIYPYLDFVLIFLILIYLFIQFCQTFSSFSMRTTSKLSTVAWANARKHGIGGQKIGPILFCSSMSMDPNAR